ncbi:hypothetical protein [Nocardioides nanhaiensis]|uniref:hypothetical protein n=1 Tax=Nocardioides nanhaiensis TaxID=1476871 RepID=UPI0031E65AA8
MVSGVSVRELARPGAWWRSARCTAETLLVVVLAHSLAGGSLPGAGWLAAVAVLMTVCGVAVLRGRVRLAVALPLLVAAQLLLHAWMHTLAAGEHAAHAAHATHAAGSGAVAGLDLPMLLAHLAGAVVTAVAWDLRARVVRVVVEVADAALLPPPAVPSAPPAARRVVVRLQQRPLLVSPLRGPPVAVASL